MSYEDLNNKHTTFKDWIVDLRNEIRSIEGAEWEIESSGFNLSTLLKKGTQLIHVDKEDCVLDTETGFYKATKENLLKTSSLLHANIEDVEYAIQLEGNNIYVYLCEPASVNIIIAESAINFDGSTTDKISADIITEGDNKFISSILKNKLTKSKIEIKSFDVLTDGEVGMEIYPTW